MWSRARELTAVISNVAKRARSLVPRLLDGCAQKCGHGIGRGSDQLWVVIEVDLTL
jgi:hypothetical protein